MNLKNFFETIKTNLNGRPGQPIVLGAARTLADRAGLEAWIPRALLILLTLMYTLPTLLAYVLLGWLLPETGDRTRGIFKGLAKWLEESIERLAEVGRDLLRGDQSGNGNPS
jgi:phage shock protein PspC (stress-responsive transcriptional regulator)